MISYYEKITSQKSLVKTIKASLEALISDPHGMKILDISLELLVFPHNKKSPSVTFAHHFRRLIAYCVVLLTTVVIMGMW